MSKLLIVIGIIFAGLFGASQSGIVGGGSGTINALDPFVATTSPFSAITTRTNARNIYMPYSSIIASVLHSTSTTATSSFAGTLSVGSTTPPASTLFSIGTSSPLFAVDKISGRISIASTSPSADFAISGFGGSGSTIFKVTGQSGGASFTGQNIIMAGGNGNTAGGAVTLTGGAVVGNGVGGSLSLGGGTAAGGGVVTLSSGGTVTGGQLNITAGNGSGVGGQVGGAIVLTTGNGSVGSTGGNAGALTLVSGNGGGTLGQAGLVSINAGTGYLAPMVALSNTRGFVGIGTSTPANNIGLATSSLTVSAGATGTTTITVGAMSTNARTCINMRSNTGTAVSAYIVGTAWVIEAGLCK